MSVMRVQVYDGEGECVLDVGVVDQVNADWLHDYLEGLDVGDVYVDSMPSGDSRSVTLQALWAEPHHLGFPLSGKTGTYASDTVMVKRDWYERLARLAATGAREP